jgi:adenosylcobinamide kinase/adenosylcobinamide-phosphate guanylyltransferase
MLQDRPDEEICTHVQGLARTLEQIPCSIAMVTNEVGWGIVPDTPMGRRFRDLAGSANQVLAEASDKVVLMTAGIPLIIKGSEPENGGRFSVPSFKKR